MGILVGVVAWLIQEAGSTSNDLTINIFFFLHISAVKFANCCVKLYFQAGDVPAQTFQFLG